MTLIGPNSATSPARLGLGIASLVLAGLLLVGFKAPQDAGLTTRGTAGDPGGTTGGAGGTGTGAGAGTGTGSGTGSTGTAGGTGTSGGASSGSSSPSGGSTSGGSAASGTYDGTVVNTRYGPVEVEITVANRKVTAATAIELPSGGRSGAISGYAAPILSGEAVTVQSAGIDLVSGATYTSEAYAQSLQSALDQAGI
jgi:uncharacterized protein with FMN-binding domain